MARKSIFEIPHYYIKLIDVKKETEDTYTYNFELPEGVDWKEGAHTHFVIPKEEINERSVRHLSLISFPKDNKISFTTRFRGELSFFKKRLQNMQKDHELLVAGFVRSIGLIREERPLVFISQGVAIATIYSLLRAYEEDNTGIEAIESINIDSKAFIYKDEFEKYQKKLPNFTHKYLENRGEFYESLDEITDKYENRAYYYVIGSNDFIEYVSKYLKNKNIKDIVTDTHKSPYKEKFI